MATVSMRYPDLLSLGKDAQLDLRDSVGVSPCGSGGYLGIGVLGTYSKNECVFKGHYPQQLLIQSSPVYSNQGANTFTLIPKESNQSPPSIAYGKDFLILLRRLSPVGALRDNLKKENRSYTYS